MTDSVALAPSTPSTMSRAGSSTLSPEGIGSAKPLLSHKLEEFVRAVPFELVDGVGDAHCLRGRAALDRRAEKPHCSSGQVRSGRVFNQANGNSRGDPQGADRNNLSNPDAYRCCHLLRHFLNNSSARLRAWS